MLSDTERQELEPVVARYPDPRTAVIDGLLVLQQYRGWISDEAVADLAALLGMTVDEVDSVATFYSRVFRRPAGKHVIAVCDSVSCFLLGGETLLALLERKLGIKAGETTPDGRFTLIPAVCLGHCEKAPVLMVDHDVHGDLTPDRLDAVLRRYREEPAHP